MKAKQNLEVVKQGETLIITNSNCPETTIIAVKNGKLVIRSFWNENTTPDSLHDYLGGLPTLQRKIEFAGKIYILASDGLDKPQLFSIEEMLNGLLMRPVNRKALKQNEDLLNYIKTIIDVVNSERQNALNK